MGVGKDKLCRKSHWANGNAALPQHIAVSLWLTVCLPLAVLGYVQLMPHLRRSNNPVSPNHGLTAVAIK
jgi:hypothetical protein